MLKLDALSTGDNVARSHVCHYSHATVGMNGIQWHWKALWLMCLFMLEVGRDCFAARAESYNDITLALVTRKIDWYKFMPIGFSYERCFFLPSFYLSFPASFLASFLPPSLPFHDGYGTSYVDWIILLCVCAHLCGRWRQPPPEGSSV